MDGWTPISSRTRNKKKKMFEDALMMSQKRKKVLKHEATFSGVDANEKVEPGSTFSAVLARNPERELKLGFEGLGDKDNPIEIRDSDDDSETEEGLMDPEYEMFLAETERKSEEDKGSFLLDDKAVNFSDYGCVPGNPVALSADEDEDDHASDSLLSSTESEGDDTSDEDFQVTGEDDDDGSETEDPTSDESDGGGDGDYVRGDKRKMVKGMVRKEESNAESCGIRERKGETKGNDQVDEDEQGIDADCTNTSSKSEIYKKEEKHAAQKQEMTRVKIIFENPEGGNSGWPTLSEAVEHMDKSYGGDQSATLQKQVGDSTVVEKSGRNNIDDMEREENQHNKETGLRGVSFGPKNQEKMGDSAKIVMEKDKERKQKYWFNSNHREKVRFVDDEAGDKELHEVLRRPSTLKNKCYKFFTECFMAKNDSVKDDSSKLDEKGDDVANEGQTQPLVSMQPIPLNCGFMNKKKPIEKSKEEKELDMLWGEMEMLLRAEKIGTQVNLSY